MAGPRVLLHLPFDQWPAADQSLWINATSDTDPFSEASGARLAAASKNQYWFAWRRFLGFLTKNELSTMKLSPDGRLTRDRVRAYVDHLNETRIPRSVAIEVDALYKAARVMMPEKDLTWLKSIKARLHLAAPLRQAGGPLITSVQLLKLGEQLMDRSGPQQSGRITLAKATCYRDGLMIAFLAFMPLRRRNLVSLEIDRHLIGTGDNRFIVIPAAETKTRTPIEFAIPEHLLPYIDTYLEIIRPRILKDRTSKALWVSPRGGALSNGAIGNVVARHTVAELGIRVTTHDTRDAAATTWALAVPSQIGVSRDLLSHSDLRTTGRHYNRARGVEASRVYSTILQIKKRSSRR
jgi:integrase